MSHSKSSHSKSLTTKRKKQRDKKRLANVAKRAKKAGKKG